MFWHKPKPKDDIEKSTIDFGRVVQVDISDLMTPKLDKLEQLLHAIKDDVARLHRRLDALLPESQGGGSREREAGSGPQTLGVTAAPAGPSAVLVHTMTGAA